MRGRRETGVAANEKQSSEFQQTFVPRLEGVIGRSHVKTGKETLDTTTNKKKCSG